MKISLFAEPVVRRDGDQLLRKIDVECALTRNATDLELVMTGRGAPSVRFPCSALVGRFRQTLWFPEPATPVQMRVELRSGAEVLASADRELTPCRPWRVHLLHQSHFDYGYTTLQSEVLRLQIGNLDTALDYIEQTRDLPEADRFRWNIECTFPLLKYLESRPSSCMERLLAANRAGSLEVAAMPFTLQSEGCTSTELIQALQPVRRLREMGFSIRTAVQSDVPGVSPLLPRLLNDIGIRHLAMAPNNFRAPFTPTALKELPRPFLWNGPHGGELLTWITDLHDHVYQEGNILGFLENLEAVENRLGSRLARLEQDSYPWCTLGLRTQGSYSDNGRPNFRIAEIVREWNARYAMPQIQMSTFSAFFDEIEHETQGRLEKVSAFWPDWWNEGIGSMARDFAFHRHSQERVQFSETALALAGADSVQARKLLDAAWENILLCDEHTWGAAAPAENEQHGPKSGDLQMACKRSFFFQGMLAAEQVENSARAHWALAAPSVATPSIAVLNSLSWARSGLVEVTLEELSAIIPGVTAWTFRDAITSGVLPSQSLERDGRTSVWIHVNDVPAFGQVAILVEPSSAPQLTSEVLHFERDLWRSQLGSQFSSLSLCPVTGGLRHWEAGDRILADESASFLFGSILHQSYARQHFFFAKQQIIGTQVNENAWLTRVEQGPLFSRVLATADCGEMKIRREWLLHHTVSRLDLFTTIQKAATNSPEAVFMALPLTIPQGKCILGTNGGPMALDAKMIPGSSSDWFVLRDHLDVAGPHGGVMISLPDTPLVQLGDIRKASVRGTGTDSRELFVYAMNNLWPTNFAPAQGGEFTFRTMLMDYTHSYDASWSRRRALECNSPLRAFAMGARTGAAATGLRPLDFQASQNVIASLSPRTVGGFTIRLEETSGQPGEVVLGFPGRNVRRLEITNIIGEAVRDLALQSGEAALSIEPNQILTLNVAVAD